MDEDPTLNALQSIPDDSGLSANRVEALILDLEYAVRDGDVEARNEVLGKLLVAQNASQLLEVVRGIRRELASFRSLETEVACRVLGLSSDTDLQIAAWVGCDRTAVGRAEQRLEARRLYPCA